MFSPNQLFNDYIADVLPELGEQNMIQMTYFQYVARRLPNMGSRAFLTNSKHRLTKRWPD